MVYGCKCVLWLATAIPKRDVEKTRRFNSAGVTSYMVRASSFTIYTQPPFHFYCFLFFMINTAHFIAISSQTWRAYPSATKTALPSATSSPASLATQHATVSRMLIPIRQCIESECSASDKDIFDAYIFGACGKVGYSATSTSREDPRTSSATKTQEIYSAQRTTLRTSSTPTALATATKSIQSSKQGVATALLPSSPSSQAQSQSDESLGTGAKAGIAVGASACVLIIRVILLILGRYQGRKRSSGKLVVLPPGSQAGGCLK